MKQNEMNSQKAQELTKEELEQVNGGKVTYIEIYHCYIDVSVNSQRTETKVITLHGNKLKKAFWRIIPERFFLYLIS